MRTGDIAQFGVARGAEPPEETMQEHEWETLSIRASQVFSPAAPIREKDLFAGRTSQLNRVIDAINQQGQHALIYGERGVGKTSLANVLAEYLESAGATGVLAPHVNCDSPDTFVSIWRKILRGVMLIERQNGIGLHPRTIETERPISDQLDEGAGPGDIVEICASISAGRLFIPIIDELDRPEDKAAVRLLTDTIKSLSDQVPRTTVVLVGVADMVEELIEEHASVERAIVQVRMPRMSAGELKLILDTGARALGMEVSAEAKSYIAGLSQGLPHYAHLLGLHSVRSALSGRSLRLELDHVHAAIVTAIDNAQHTLQQAYHRAVISQRPEALYRQVLLAAALARTDELGYFANADVREPMSKIMGKRYEIPQFTQHLAAFCEPARGEVLERVGAERNYRYRFTNPLLQPFVIMQGLAAGLIGHEDVRRPEAELGGEVVSS